MEENLNGTNSKEPPVWLQKTPERLITQTLHFMAKHKVVSTVLSCLAVNKSRGQKDTTHVSVQTVNVWDAEFARTLELSQPHYMDMKHGNLNTNNVSFSDSLTGDDPLGSSDVSEGGNISTDSVDYANEFDDYMDMDFSVSDISSDMTIASVIEEPMQHPLHASDSTVASVVNELPEGPCHISDITLVSLFDQPTERPVNLVSVQPTSHVSDTTVSLVSDQPTDMNTLNIIPKQTVY